MAVVIKSNGLLALSRIPFLPSSLLGVQMFLTRFLIAASMCMAAISFCTEDLNAQAGRRGGFGVRGGGFGGGGGIF